MKKLLLLFLLILGVPAITLAQTTDPLEGKRIGVLGDSYVKNHRRPYTEAWHYLFAQKHHMKYYNYGRNGNCIAFDREKWGPAMYKRYKEMNDSLDYIVVIGGHNDTGFVDSLGLDTFKSRLRELCEGLCEKYPKGHIYFFTPWAHANPSFIKVVDAMLEMCGSYGIPVFDAYRNSNIHSLNDNFRRIYFQGKERDHAHLNAEGHKRFLPVAEQFILSH